MSFFIAVVAAILLIDAIWWLAADRVLARAGLRARARLIHAIFCALQFAGLLIIIFSRRSAFPVELPRAVLSAVYIWHLLVAPALLPLVLIGALLAVSAWIYRKVRQPSASAAARAAETSEAEGISRRRFLAATAVLAPQLLTVSLTGIGLQQLQQFRTRRVDVPIHNLPAALDGVTIAHISDTHVGRFTTGKVLHEITRAVNDLRADLVVLTGDLINGALHEIPEAVEMLRRLDAHSGIYMIEGNHDLFEGRREFAEGVKASGVPLLVNQSAELTLRGHPVNMLGLRWGGEGPGARPRSNDAAIRSAVAELLPARDPDAFPILLAHHPHAFDAAADAGIPLTLAGHTHGGQLMLNRETGFGPMMFRYWTGLYSRGDSQLIVSNGAGNWFPLRTSAPAEIVHLTLRRV